MSSLLLAVALIFLQPAAQAQTNTALIAASGSTDAPALLTPDQVAKLLPPSVYFRGQTAPLQLRNASAIRYRSGAVVFASLVDTSGYSTGVRERYQFYLVTELPLSIAGKPLAAGAYGAGFLEDGTFVVMDIGGHDVLLSRTQRDDDMHRPRPLQFVQGATAQQFRLYLGKSFIPFSATPR